MLEAIDDTRIVNKATNMTRNANMGTMRKIRDYINPITDRYGFAVVRLPIRVNNFELKALIIQLIQNNAHSGRLLIEDSNQHITNFFELYSIIKIKGFSEEKIRRRLFPFPLQNKVRRWLQAQPKNSFATWEEVARLFSNKYF